MTSPGPMEAAFSPAERIARLRLARTKGIGAATFTKLMGLYGTAEQAIAALPGRARLAGRAVPSVPSPDRIEDEIAWLAERGACHLLRSDPAYPRLLATLPDAPVLLFARGDTALLSAPSLAIVGARKASSPALDLTEQFAAGLAEAGLAIVSGLARGIDGAAHRGALPTGRTIAALPGGLDVTYPREHAHLQEEIARQGCLLTEYPPGTIASARHFPRRNHLIAGISRGCLLVEAARRSGTLITARLALAYQRLLFAVPGFPKDPRSGGGNDLLRQNKALLVERFEEILDTLGTVPLPGPVPAAWSRPPARQPSLFPFPAENDTSRYRAPSQEEAPQPHHDTMPTGVGTVPAEAAGREPPAESRYGAPGRSVTAPRPSCRAAPRNGGASGTAMPDGTATSPGPREKNGDAKNILSLLAHTPSTVDEIASRCQLSISAVAAILIGLEMDGAIQRHEDGRITTL